MQAWCHLDTNKLIPDEYEWKCHKYIPRKFILKCRFSGINCFITQPLLFVGNRIMQNCYKVFWNKVWVSIILDK